MSFATTATATIDAGYALGDAAVYDACGGSQKAVTVIPTEGAGVALDAGVGVRTTDYAMTVRKAEVAEPKAGDRVTTGGIEYRVDAVQPINAWEWLLDVRKA